MSLDFLAENKGPILVALSVGVISLAALRKFLYSQGGTTSSASISRSLKFPTEIDFSDKRVQSELGKDLNEFLTHLNKNSEEYMIRLRNLYPNECSLKLGKQQIVFINSIESFKKFNQKVSSSLEPIANRPQNPIFQLISKNYLGSFFRLYDDKLKEIRKSSLAGLHKLSANAVEFEAKLAEEVQEFTEFLAGLCSSSIDHQGDEHGRLNSASVHLQQISTNMIVTVGINARFPYELDMNAAVKEQINNMSEILSALDVVNISNLSDTSAFKPLEPKLNSIYEFLTGAINGYKPNYEKDVIRTFADYVISKQLELKNLKPEDVYSDRDILVQFFTLLMAGAATTGFTLAWAFYLLGKNPNVQQKMFEEIEKTVGTSSSIETKHRAQLKYSEAAISEILRLASTQPFIPRATVATAEHQVKIDEYILPSDTPVFVNAFAIHRDPKHWPNSEQLDPNRWLNERGELASHLNSYIPFGAGPRSCIGDALSRMIIYLIVVNVVQRFEIKVADNNNDASEKLKSRIGVMRKAPNFDLELKVRK